MVGVAYKGGTSDTRESPALKIIDLLLERGADVAYHDDFVPEIGGTLRSVPLDEGLEAPTSPSSSRCIRASITRRWRAGRR